MNLETAYSKFFCVPIWLLCLVKQLKLEVHLSQHQETQVFSCLHRTCFKWREVTLFYLRSCGKHTFFCLMTLRCLLFNQVANCLSSINYLTSFLDPEIVLDFSVSPLRELFCLRLSLLCIRNIRNLLTILNNSNTIGLYLFR